MCGIAGLQLRQPALRDQLGRLTAGMLAALGERGPDAAGVGIYGDPSLTPPGWAAVSMLAASEVADPEQLSRLAARLDLAVHQVKISLAGNTVVVAAPVLLGDLVAGVTVAYPDAMLIGRGHGLAVMKATGHPADLVNEFGLTELTGWQAVGHTRMATESAVTAAHSHPFAVTEDLCLVHNGSFANHATIRRELQAQGVPFDSDNDSEVAARWLGVQLAEDADLEKSLRLLCERFDGFYTLLVGTANALAVVRDAVACKPAIVAQTEDWVAVVSEYRALEGLPGLDGAQFFEPGPEQVHVWTV
jgi:glutamate synthase domain-containing protein 1